MRCSRCGTVNALETSVCNGCKRRLIAAEVILALDEKTKYPVGSVLVILLSVLYLLNPSAGVDLFPDFIPMIGNLDEVGAVLLILKSASNIGWMHFSRRREGEVIASIAPTPTSKPSS